MSILGNKRNRRNTALFLRRGWITADPPVPELTILHIEGRRAGLYVSSYRLQENIKMVVNIDAVFKVIGEFGPYQKRVYFFICLPILFVGASNLAFVFIAAVPNYRCLVPYCDLNLTNPTYNEKFVQYTIPIDPSTGVLSQCSRYERLDNSSTTCKPDDYSHQQIECPEGKVFDKAVYESTLVSEFNLTCQDTWEGEAAQTVYFGGVLTGALLFGVVADKFGRKVTLVVSAVLMAASGIIIALVSSVRSFNVVRFLNAAVTTGVFQNSLILGMECVGPSVRVMCGILGEYFYALGEVVLGLVAWWTREWRMLQLLISAPVSCFIFYWWIIPESPRWLQACGEHEKVTSVLEKFARKNKKTIPPDLLMGSSDISSTPTLAVVHPVTLLDVVRTPLLCIHMFFMFFIWIVTTLVYYGLSLNSTELSAGGDSSSRPYVNFILTALVEFPGYSLAWAGMMMWGRRASLALSLVLAGLSCTAAGFTAEYSEGLELIPALIGKCFITCAFGIIYVFTSELFPTNVRGTVLGLCSMWARIGGMLAPFSSALTAIYRPLPLILFGGSAVVAGALSMTMPETLGTNLPDTVGEALRLGRSECVDREEYQALLGESTNSNYGTEEAPLSEDEDGTSPVHHELIPPIPATESEA